MSDSVTKETMVRSREARDSTIFRFGLRARVIRAAIAVSAAHNTPAESAAVAALVEAVRAYEPRARRGTASPYDLSTGRKGARRLKL